MTDVPKCETCGGKGKQPFGDPYRRPCPTCNGTGDAGVRCTGDYACRAPEHIEGCFATDPDYRTGA